MHSIIAIMCHNIGPYHAARFRALADLGIAAEVVELSSKEARYPWLNMSDESGIKVRTLFDRPVESLGDKEQKIAVEAALASINPDVVVSIGYSESGMRAASKWARRNIASSIMCSDSTYLDRPRRYLVEKVKGDWCRKNYDAMFISGVRSQSYFAGLSFPANHIWRGYDVVDNEFFLAQSDLVRANPNEVQLRKVLPERYFLCVSRLVTEKNIANLITAHQMYASSGGEWDLVIVGEGGLEEDLRNQAKRVMGDKVVFLGWRQYHELPAIYALASAFVLPSVSEPWGLVVNEAMACGLPVLVSRRCGCIPELCWRGINGYDFDPAKPSELVDAMFAISSDKDKARMMGEASRDIIANFTSKHWAHALADCVNRTKERLGLR